MKCLHWRSSLIFFELALPTSIIAISYGAWRLISFGFQSNSTQQEKICFDHKPMYVLKIE